MLSPLRDQMGLAGGVKNLPWLFTATFSALLIAQPLYGALVARLPRARFIPIVYHFFVANLLLFWVLLTFEIKTVIVARVFFVWVSVFNLFAVAVFWSFMADLFTPNRASVYSGLLAPVERPVHCWARSSQFGSLSHWAGKPDDCGRCVSRTAVFCVYRLERVALHAGSRSRRQSIGGSAFAAIPELIRSPYLLGMGTWVGLALVRCNDYIFRTGPHRFRGSKNRRTSDLYLCQLLISR